MMRKRQSSSVLSESRSASPSHANNSLIPQSHASHASPQQQQTTRESSVSSVSSQCCTQLPVKTMTHHSSRPSSISSIPQISSPNNAKTNAISRNKNMNQSSNHHSILDKIKLFRGSGTGVQQTPKEDNNHLVNGKTECLNASKTSNGSVITLCKTDWCESVCGVDVSVSASQPPIAINKSKPVVNVTKTSRNNNSNNCSSNSAQLSNNNNINSSNNNNTSISSTSLNNEHKKCDEIINSDNKINSNSNNININKSLPSNSKPALIPVKRTGIPPPRSRPTSTIIDRQVNLSTMSSNCQSTSNSSLTAITKPTAAVKGTSKFSCDQSTSKVGSSRKLEIVCSPPPTPQSSQSQDTVKIINVATSQQLQPSNSKPEATIAMVSPIMSREHQSKLNSKKEGNEDKNKVNSVNDEQCILVNVNDLNKQNIDVILKVDEKQAEQTNNQNNEQQKQQQQQPDSASSSHGEESASNSDVDSSLINIKPMEPLVRTSQFAFLRNNANSSNNQLCNNGNGSGNSAMCSRFANNYSTIEKGYMSDCTLVNNGANARPATNRCAPVINGHNVGYLSESGVVCSPQIRKNQLPVSKYECVNASHRHYHDADSAANITATRAANLFHLMHTKHNNMINTHYPQFCLDDSSSLSSDPGMISGTEASGTTTTSSISSSTGDPIVNFLTKPNSKYISSNSSKLKSTVKKTDSSMQTESVSALSSASVWKKYLHEHHLMMKANNTVAPKIVATNDDSSKSLDRLDSRIPNGSQTKKPPNNAKIVERHDSCDSLKHGTNKNANLKQELLSTKRPLSSPISSRVASSTFAGSPKPHSGQRHNNRCKTLASTQSDAIHSDSEYMHHKQHQQQQSNLQNIINSKYALHLSPLRQRDTNLRSIYSSIGANDTQSGLNKSTISPWLQRHALTIQRDAITEAESMESLTAPSLDGSANYFLSRHHSMSSTRPNSATIRLRESASASPAPNISSHNRSKEHSSQLMRNGSIRGNISSDATTTHPSSPTVYMSPVRTQHSQHTQQQQCCIPSVNNSQCKEVDQMHASSLSLVSSSSQFSTAEDKNSQEMRKIRRELDHSNEKVSKKLSHNSGWLRRSFTKAFKKNKSGSKRGSVSDAEIIGSKGSETEADSNSVPNSPLMSNRLYHEEPNVNACNDYNETESVMELRRQLREKEMILIDVRLDYLTSAYQLENLKETVNQMRVEMMNLKQDNDRLQRLLSSKSLESSQSSMISAHTGQHVVGSTFVNNSANVVATEDNGHNIENL